MVNEILDDAKERMEKSLESLRQDLAKVRTGRAHPGILSHIMVDYYGVETPLVQMANVSVLDARTLGITPWEKGIASKIEKAILMSDLGLNPANLGDSLRIPMPALNEERRRDLTKVVRAEAEKGRISIRNIRRDANSDIKDLLKEKELSEDEAKKAEEKIQNVTNKMIVKVEVIVQEKEQDLMAI